MDEFEKYLNSTLRFLSYRPRSEKEIKDKLLKKNVSLAGIEKILIFLREHRFVNDQEFAEWWLEQRTLVRPRSKRVIKMELRQKGIDEYTIDDVLSKIDSESEVTSATKLIEKKLGRYQNQPQEKIYQKLQQMLLRKGFDYEVIKAAIDAVLGKRV